MRALDVRVEAALATVDEDCRWELIGGIVGECPDDVLEKCQQLLRDETARERTLGADILGRFVGVDAGARPAALTALLAALSVRNRCLRDGVDGRRARPCRFRGGTRSDHPDWPETRTPAFDSPSPSPSQP